MLEIRRSRTWASKSYSAVTYSTAGSGFGLGFTGGGGGARFVAAAAAAPFAEAEYGGGGAAAWVGGGGGAFLTKEDVAARDGGGIERLLVLAALATLGERPMEAEPTASELPPVVRLACTSFAGGEEQ